MSPVLTTGSRSHRGGCEGHDGPTTTPGVGTWAVLTDPQGAAFGLLQPES